MPTFNIPIHPLSRHLLRFVWKDQTYQFSALPFGLNTAPSLFTEVMKTVARVAHKQGVHVHMYQDDWLINEDSLEQ